MLLILFPVHATYGSQTFSLQYKSWTSNAGGQEAYSLRWEVDDEYEWALFSNQFLITGNYPLTGLLWDLKYTICGRSCFLGLSAQTGIGLSTAGPVIEFLWSIRPLWLIRIDMATHLYFSQPQPIVWSYPFWIGVSIPF